jgi:transcriptional regulator with XRE-family HTH domain
MEKLILFGKRIRSVRESAGLSRESVAETASITANYLGEIERGEKWPSIEVISSVAGALGVSPSTLFAYEAEEVDPKILQSQLYDILEARNTEQLQQALRIVKAMFLL